MFYRSTGAHGEVYAIFTSAVYQLITFHFYLDSVSGVDAEGPTFPRSALKSRHVATYGHGIRTSAELRSSAQKLGILFSFRI